MKVRALRINDVPDKLCRQLKSRAALEGKTLRAFILETLESAVQSK